MGDLDDLELRLKVKAEGLESFDKAAASTKAVGKAAESATGDIDELVSALNAAKASGKDLNQALYGILAATSQYSEGTKKAAAATLANLGATDKLTQSYNSQTSAASAASKQSDKSSQQADRETAAINRQIIALERRGKLAGQSATDRINTRRDFSIEDLGKTEANLGKINVAYDRFYAAEVRKAEDAARKISAAQGRQLESSLSSLESRASRAGKSRPEQLGIERDTLVKSLGGNEAAIGRVQSAYGKLIEEESKFSLSQQQLGAVLGYNNARYVSLAENLGGLTSAIGVVGVVALGSAAAFAAAAVGTIFLANSLAKTSLEVINFSERTGLSIENSQLFLKTAELAGVEGTALEASMRKLSSAMADNGLEGKAAADALQRLGVNAYEVATGKLRPMDEVLPEILSALKGVSNEADRNTLALTLLGRSGKELLPLIENYSKYADQVKATGVVISEEGIRKADDYRRSLALLGDTWSSLVNKLKTGAVGITAGALSIFSGLATSVTGRGGGLSSQIASDTADDQRRTQAALDAPKIAANNAQIEAIKAQERGNSPEQRLQFQRTDLDDQIKKGVAALKSNVDPSVNADAEKALSLLIQQRDGIDAKLKSTKEYEETVKRVAELEKTAASAGLTGEEKLEAQRKESLLTLGKSADLIKRINAAYAITAGNERSNILKRYQASTNALTSGATRTDLERQGRDAVSAAEQNSEYKIDDTAVIAGYGARVKLAQQLFDYDTKSGEQELKSAKTLEDRTKALENLNKAAVEYYKTVKDAQSQRDRTLRGNSDKIGQSAYAADKEIGQIPFGEQAAGIQARYSIASSIQAQGQTPNSVSAIQAQFSLRRQEESELNAVRQAQINTEDDADKRRVDQAQLESEIRKQALSDEVEQTNKILELRKEQKAQADDLSRGLYSSLKNHNSNFFRDQTSKLTEQLFVNATSPILSSATLALGGAIQGQHGADGQKTGIGKLLSGTILEDKGNPQDIQIASVKDNSTAVRSLTSVMQDYLSALNGSGSSVATKNVSAVAGAGLGSALIPGVLGSPLQSPSATLSGLISGNASLGLPQTAGGVTNGGSTQSLMAALAGSALIGTSVALAVEKYIGPAKSIAYSTTSGLTSKVASGSTPLSVTAANTNSSNYTRANVFGALAGGGAALLTAIPALTKSLGANGSLSSLGGLGTAFSNFTKGGTNLIGSGSGHGADQLYHAITGGDYSVQTGDGTAATASSLGLTSTAGRIGAIAGAAGAVASGITGIVAGIKQGGAKGTLGAVSSGLGTAAALDPEPISKAVLSVLSVGSSIIKSLFGDPRAQFAKQQNEEITQEQLAGSVYTQPGVHLNEDSAGNATVYNYKGQISSLNSKATVQTNQAVAGFDPYDNNLPLYSTFRSVTNTPNAPVAAPAAQQVNVTVQTLDSKSFMDHSDLIASAVSKSLQTTHRLSNDIRQVVGPH